MMIIFQGIMDKLPPFEKYWSHMFQNKSMHFVSECQSNVFPFDILCDELLSTEYDTEKEKSPIIW